MPQNPADIRGLGGVQKFLSRDEVALLTQALEEGERVRAAAGGLLGRTKGLLAATTHRIVFVAGRKVRSWGYSRVERVHAEVDLDDAALTLHADHEVFVVKNVHRLAAQAFADAVRDATPTTQFRRVRLVDATQDASLDHGLHSIVNERLQAIRRQLDKGSITEAEYRANRRRILETAGLPTDLRLGMSTKQPIKEPGPLAKKDPDPWPDHARPAPAPSKKPQWPDPRLPK